MRTRFPRSANIKLNLVISITYNYTFHRCGHVNRFSICLAYATVRSLMSPERHVKVFKNGRNQAVRIPREFEFSSEEAIMRKEGDRLVIEPVPPKSLLAVLATLAPLHEDFPPIQDLPPDPVDL